MTLLLFAACSKEEGDANVKDDERVPLRIVSNIVVEQSARTRAFNSEWEDNDAIGVYASMTAPPSDYSELTNGSGVNRLYTIETGAETKPDDYSYQLFEPTEGVYPPINGDPIHVFAYYPYKNTATDYTAVPINIADQNTPAKQSAVDFMTTGVVSATTHGGSTPISSENPSCELLFTHRLVKLQFNLKKGDELLAGEISGATALSIKIDHQPTAATYNIFTNDISITEGSTEITAAPMATAETGYEKSFEAIVMPNKMTAEGGELANNELTDRTVTITITYASDNQTFSYKFTIGNTTSFVSGNKYVYNVTVNGYSIVVNPLKFTEQW